MTKKVSISVTCPHYVLAISTFSPLISSIMLSPFKYEIQVEMTNGRAFLVPANVCMAPPPDESSDLWK